MTTTSPDEIRDFVKDYYAKQAAGSTSCCGSEKNNLLYQPELLEELPADIANFTLGCGDPITLAKLQPGETVLDLGSGGGLDCFLARRQVGEKGHVIGLDMTPEMLSRSRQAASRLGYTNVEFRQGFLEQMPVEHSSVDVIISNCVINLSPDKPAVFTEMYRTLKPGGRISISDIVTNGPLPENILKNMAAWGACVAGALSAEEYAGGLKDAGFIDIEIAAKTQDGELQESLPDLGIFSAAITANKPG